MTKFTLVCNDDGSIDLLESEMKSLSLWCQEHDMHIVVDIEGKGVRVSVLNGDIRMGQSDPDKGDPCFTVSGSSSAAPT